MTDPMKKRPELEGAEAGREQLAFHAERKSGMLQEEPESFLKRRGLTVAVGVGSIGAIALVAFLFASGDKAPPPRVAPELTIVNIIPPPPPPPPPPQETPPPPEPEPEMIEQPKVEEPDTKPDKVVDEPDQVDSSDEPPPGPLGLDAAAADGPGDLFNLAGRPGGRGLGEGGGRAGTRWGWYASIVTQQVEIALRANPKTRHLVGQVQVRLWADGSGRVSRVQIVNGSGNAEIDAMISGQVLGGIMLREPPPADMPMPIVTRITGRKTT